MNPASARSLGRTEGSCRRSDTIGRPVGELFAWKRALRRTVEGILLFCMPREGFSCSCVSVELRGWIRRKATVTVCALRPEVLGGVVLRCRGNGPASHLYRLWDDRTAVL